jgi:hypothetical protein
MATLLKVLNNLADIKSAGVLHFASELRDAYFRRATGANYVLPLESFVCCNVEGLQEFEELDDPTAKAWREDQQFDANEWKS